MPGRKASLNKLSSSSMPLSMPVRKASSPDLENFLSTEDETMSKARQTSIPSRKSNETYTVHTASAVQIDQTQESTHFLV
jgi:hypothetical protein